MKETTRQNVIAAAAVIGAVFVAALLMFILAHVSLTMHYTAVRAVRNDRAINGIIDKLTGYRAIDGNYKKGSDASMWELEIRTIELLQVLHDNGLTEIREWPETPRSITWSMND